MEIETIPVGTSSFDVLIVGTGPAGLLAAYDVLQQRPATSILLVDAGPPLAERRARGGSELEGYGGAGLYIGGRLYLGTFSIPVMPPGTPPREMHAVLEGEAYARRAQVVDTFFKRLGAESEVIATPPEHLAEAVEQAAEVGIEYITSYPARPLGMEERFGILAHLRGFLEEAGARFAFGRRVREIVRAEDGGAGFRVKLAGGASDAEQVAARALLLAPGRYGAEWLSATTLALGAQVIALPSAFGVRVEIPAATYAPLTDVTPDPRLHRTLAGDDALVKTYATCPGGLVVPVTRYGAQVASGVPLPRDRRSENTTFAVLVQPGIEGAAGRWHGGEALTRTLNERYPESLVVQRLEDIRARRGTSARALEQNSVRPTCASAEAGTLYDVYPDAYWETFDDFLGRIERLAPGTMSGDALVYGPAEERFWYFPTDEQLQTTTPGLFVAGDAAGQSQGIIQASVAGVLAGEGIRAYLG